MRVAILVLGIIGSVIAFSIAACVGACAGSMASCGQAIEESSVGLIEEDGTEITEEEAAENMSDFNEATTAVGSIALSVGFQGVLGLAGCIMAFISLGKGSRSIVGGVLLMLAVIVSIWALITIPTVTGLSTGIHFIAAILALIAPFSIPSEEE